MQTNLKEGQTYTTTKDYDVERNLYKELYLDIPTKLNEDVLHHLLFWVDDYTEPKMHNIYQI